MAHTPGPWRIGDAGHTIFGPPAGLPPITVASVEKPRVGSARDNAVLIAAAPDLLAALAAIVNARDEAALADDPAYHWIDEAIQTARNLMGKGGVNHESTDQTS